MINLKTYDYKEEVSNTYLKAMEDTTLEELTEGDLILIEVKETGANSKKTTKRYSKFMGKTEKFFYQVDYCGESFGKVDDEVRIVTKVLESKDKNFTKRTRTSIDRVVSVKKVKSEVRNDVMTYHTTDLDFANKMKLKWKSRKYD